MTSGGIHQVPIPLVVVVVVVGGGGSSPISQKSAHSPHLE